MNSAEDICRVCFVPGDLVSLFESTDSIQLSVKMMLCASVKVFMGDDFPSGICGRCLERLNISYDFRLQCEESESKLRENLGCLKISAVERDGDCDFKPLRLHKIKRKTEKLSKRKLRRKDDERPKKLQAATKNDFSPGVDKVNKVEEDSRGVTDESETPAECLALQNGEETGEDMTNGYIKKQEETVNGKKAETKAKKSDRRQQQCVTCGRIMSSRYRLQMHQRTHTGEKPHACRVCEKRFSLAQSLRVHERTHTGEKPLACTTCGKTFAQAAGLASHVRLHTGETPYRCAFCPMSFRTTAHHQYHVRKHTGEKSFECTACGRAFITRGDLKQHARVHTGERPFVCTVCGARMTRSSHLTRHMMTHTGEKPHRCPVCGSSYAQRGDLLRHAKRHLTNS